MTKKFSNLLLGLLWLMTITLATTFWMNIKYGFNIFSAAHWAYLSELQAYRTDIKPDFYISLIVAIIIGLTGLYLLARQKMQTFFIEPSQMPPPPQSDTPNILTLNKPTKPVHQPIQDQNSTKPVAPHIDVVRPMSPTGLSRNQPTPNDTRSIPTPKPKIMVPTPSEPSHTAEITKILEDNGYIVKPCARIGKLVKPVVALSYDQTVWICSENVSTTDITDALQTMITVFDDTLGDSAGDINVHGCIISAPNTPENSDTISTFATLQEFQEFITTHPNNKPADYDAELFDAVSTYISTVTNYIGKQ